jgi:pimeloyl-ACP methyl ester carboxylesterase
MIVRRYTQLHPDRVAGIVFVDAFAPSIKPRFGDLWPQYLELLNHPGLALDQDPTWETVDADEAIATLDAGPPLPSFPFAVVSKALPFGVSPSAPPDVVARLEEAWPQVQDAIVEEVGASQPPHVIATGSDHYVQLHDPDVVIATVKVVLDRIAAVKGG